MSKNKFCDIKVNEIEIEVIGGSSVGKTTIQLLISDMLISHGFNIKLTSNGEEDWDELKATLSSEKLRSIVDKTKEIRISEVRGLTPMNAARQEHGVDPIGINVGTVHGTTY